MYYGMCISGLCQSLAEILKYRTYVRGRDSPVDIRTRVFVSNDEIREYIVEEVG
jgi:hypothetical protein